MAAVGRRGKVGHDSGLTTGVTWSGSYVLVT
jgi:hypothetical protein